MRGYSYIVKLGMTIDMKLVSRDQSCLYTRLAGAMN